MLTQLEMFVFALATEQMYAQSVGLFLERQQVHAIENRNGIQPLFRPVTLCSRFCPEL